MSKILITGGLGFIGHHLALKLSKNNIVGVVDNLSRPFTNKNSSSVYSKDYNWQYLEKYYPKIQKKILDIRDKDKISNFIQNFKPEIIIHAAGQTSAVDSITNPEFDFENNVIGLFNVLNAAKKMKQTTDFIFISTNKVYGNNVHKIPLFEGEKRFFTKDENFKGFSESLSIDNSIHTPYGISKLSGDLYVQEFGKNYGMKNSVFRLSCIYGDQQFGILGQGFISYMLLNAINNRKVQIFGNGKQVRDILYIDDLTSLIEIYLKATSNEIPKVFNQKSRVYNIGGGINNTISLLELVEKFEYHLKKKIEVEFLDWRTGDQKLYISDISKITSEFKWKPSVNPDDGILKMINWLNSNNNLLINDTNKRKKL